MKLMFPSSVRNWLSLAGVIIVLTSLFMIVFLFIVASVLKDQAVYLGLVIYILLPSVMIVGLLLIPVGMLREMKREQREGEHPGPGWPRIDLAEPRHRHAFFIFVIGTAIFVLLSAVGSYEAFHYSESTKFCGTLCHSVMEPEYTAHSHSPHAQVACAACHVGPGADWYARSKLSGLYQVYATMADVYPKPIPTPIKHLRPARAVCEQCHWPRKFYGHKLQLRTHYLSDRDNTPWRIGLNLKVGPPQSALGLIEGIHWHINPRVRIEYIAADRGRQQIPWVRYTNLDSAVVKVFRDREQPADSPAPAGEIRTMDCMDCHNRPSHLYRAPAQFIDSAITAGRIPAQLPEIKKVAVRLCTSPYASPDLAMQGIRTGITQFYRASYPDLFARQFVLVEKGVAGVQQEFSENIFPLMGVTWKAYPDNIGHFYFPGCFRCHNGTHQSDQREAISADCNLCHDVVVQGIAGKGIEAARIGESLAFRHPEDIGDAWQQTPCTDCHTGGPP
ncbi:MAG: cytochrome C [Geobacteraceae bacterium GWC2_58_44]|nr:MAG: cytochrome C [Geobacteraceae bacterium GWC2_58_44]HBG03963.1 cytochrome C [Geobacter sp.]